MMRIVTTYKKVNFFLILLTTCGAFAHEGYKAYRDDNDRIREHEFYAIQLEGTHDESLFGGYKKPLVDAAGIGAVGLAYYALSCGIAHHKSQRTLKYFVQKNHEKTRADFAHHYALKYDQYTKPKIEYDAKAQYEILANHELYQFAGYREFIEALPEYPVYIKNLHKKLQEISTANQKEVMPGFSGGQLYDVVNTLNRELLEKEWHQQLARQLKREQELRTIINAQRERVTEYLKTARQDMEYANAEDSAFIEQLHNERWQALQDPMPYSNGYSISPQARQVLIDCGYDPRVFNKCIGAAIQHRLHLEFILALNRAVLLQVIDGDCKALLRTVIDFSYAGCQANKEGHVLQSISAADFCWNMLAYIKKERKDRPIYMGIIDGTAQAGSNIGHALSHPVQTAVGFGVGYGVLTLAKIPAKILAESAMFAACPPLYPAIKTLSLAHTAYQAIETIKLVGERPTMRDAVREGVCFGIEYVTYGALIDELYPAGAATISAARKTGTQLKNALQETVAFLQKAKKPPVPAQLAVAEGVGEELSIKFSSSESGDPLKPNRGSGKSGGGGLTAQEIARLEKLQKFELGVDDLVKKYGDNAVRHAKEAHKVTEYKILKNDVTETLNTLEKLASDAKRGTESKPHRANFCVDAGHGGGITVGSIGEGLTACAAEDQGFFKQLTRALEKEVDFIDELGRRWDVKNAASVRPENAQYKFVVEDFLELVMSSLEKDENVVIDVTCLNQIDLNALTDAINRVLPTNLGDLKVLYIHRFNVNFSIFIKG